MKILDPLFRRLGYQKTRQKSAPSRRGFAAAGVNRLTHDWPSAGFAIDGMLMTDLPVLRQRARDLAINNDYFRKFLSMLRCNVNGQSGLTLNNKASEPPTFQDGDLVPGALDKLANHLIEGAWAEWGKKENCTVGKNLTWLQVQNLALTEWGTCGETLWQIKLAEEAKNKFGFALKPIAIDRLNHSYNYNLENGNKVRMGVEKNEDGKIIAYWLTDSDPTDSLDLRGNQFTARRYPAEMFVRPFMMERIDQTRGIPWAAASMLRLKMLNGYDVATLTAAEVAACKMGFITREDVAQEYQGDETSDGGKTMDAEPGMLEQLSPGQGVEVVDWNQPSGNYEPFVSACLRGIAAGLNVSYPNLANDYASVNFSSGRMARQEETETWKMIQTCFASDFHEPIFSKWLEYALLAGEIKFTMQSGREIVLPASKREKFDKPQFNGRRWGWVDPTKEVSALESQLRLGITSHTRICSELGIDRDDLFDEIKDDKAAADLRGIELPPVGELMAAPAPDMPDAPDDEPPTKTNGNGRFHLNGK